VTVAAEFLVAAHEAPMPFLGMSDRWRQNYCAAGAVAVPAI